MPLPTILSGNVASALGGGFEVANSCRFNDGDSPKMTKSLGTATNNKKWTVNCWLKLGGGIIGNNKVAWSARNGTSGPYVNFNLQGSDNDHQLVIYGPDTDGANDFSYRTSRKFRDQSAWYMITVAMDTTLGTAGDRLRIYVNGVEETDFAEETNPTQNKVYPANYTGYTFVVGARTDDSEFWDGYIAEFCMIDGQQLTPTSFGEFDEDSPTIFKPIDVSGLTFGNNGFYLDFEDSSNLGNDANGGTDLTEANLAAADQATDTPTNSFCTLNPLVPARNFRIPQSGAAFSEGNCKFATSNGSSDWGSAMGTIGLTAGKWYAECKLQATSNNAVIGLKGTHETSADKFFGETTGDYSYYATDGDYYPGVGAASGVSYGDSYTTNDIIGVYVDLDNNKLYFAKNGTVQNSGTGISITDPASVNFGLYVLGCQEWNSGGNGTFEWNFGGCPAFAISSGNADANGYGNFEYDPSSGTFDSASKDFLAICTKNLAEYG